MAVRLVIKGPRPQVQGGTAVSVAKARNKNRTLKTDGCGTRRMFAVLGPLLLGRAAIGIYAVVSCAVARRTREIGVRLAFGATSGRVVLQIVRENLRSGTSKNREDAAGQRREALGNLTSASSTAST